MGEVGPQTLRVTAAAARPADDVLAQLGATPTGLSTAEAHRRLAAAGPNAVRSHRARALPVLWHQVRSPLLGLLLAAALASVFVGEHGDAVIIAVIVGLSVGLGFINEFRAERAAQALHSRVRHTARVVRDGETVNVDVEQLVPGDVVELRGGDVVPADLRLLACDGLSCDESVLTGESQSVDKDPAPVAGTATLAELTDAALMGTVVHAGTGRGVVVASGPETAFGRVAAGLGAAQTETAFQAGLRRFSLLLVYIGGTLTTAVFAINVLLHRPILEAALFSLAIAVGITPQLLPAIVSTSLAVGSRQLAHQRVLVKRLVCIEDLGNVDTLFTDKTGTLTEGSISFVRAVPLGRWSEPDVLRWSLLCSAGGEHADRGNPLDDALWQSPATAGARDAGKHDVTVATVPFDHERRLMSVLVRPAVGDQIVVTKGAPEAVLARCADVPDHAREALDTEFAAGNRVIAVAVRAAPGVDRLTVDDERDLQLAGLLVFLDPPKPAAKAALRRLADLGISVKIVTGDNPVVARKLCQDLGLANASPLTGVDIDRMDDRDLAAAIGSTTVFARVSPEQKARLVTVHRRSGRAVAFLGDGVNDALGLHAADVGISVDSAVDVAKDAADVILLEKDLNVLANGVVGGRRVFANTVKYVLMGTSSNFGNMFSAAGASLFLPFLPMLPSQILLNNLLYDTSQLTIPTDHVDDEQLRRPAHWDIRFIRRFMLYFGPLSSLFDFATFAILLWVFHAGPDLFRSGWFVESLATQTLVIFAIRTRRSPFWRSTPSLALIATAVIVVAVGATLPATPLGPTLGFAPVSTALYVTLAVLVVAYLLLIEIGKRVFFRGGPTPTVVPLLAAGVRQLRRRAHRFSHG
ncbi:MAG: magnesium-translocating P-type ATPase [Micromonosporaceae bacterium]|nr:magnesium-translocating P-type ATPase [Micromonosporaceae bacterium]